MKTRHREFLEPARNDVDSYVAVAYYKDESWPSMELKVADCNRNVNLHFGLSKNKIKTSRRKLEKLKKAIAMLEAWIEMHE